MRKNLPETVDHQQLHNSFIAYVKTPKFFRKYIFISQLLQRVIGEFTPMYELVHGCL